MFYGLYLVAKKIIARKIPQHATSSLVVLSIAVGLVGFFLGRYNIKLPLFWASSMTAIPDFCAGHVAFRYTKILAPNRMDKFNIPFALLGFGLVVALAWNAPPDSVSYVSNRYWFPIWSVYLCGILGTLAVLFLYICRSPTGEYCLKKELGPDFEVMSAGLGALVDHPAHELSQKIALEHGIDMSAHRARQINLDILKRCLWSGERRRL